MHGLITGGSVLVGTDHEPTSTSVTWREDRISALGETAGEADFVIDAQGCLVAPGIIDLHGDAFERSLMPRGGVPVSLATALDDNDAQLLASGITTSYLSATDSWEPGLRSRDTLREIVTALRERPASPRTLLHVRHERCNVADPQELTGWMADGSISVLSYNDHTPGGIAHISGLNAGQVARSGVSEAELTRMLDEAMANRGLGRDQEQEIARVAAARGVVTASHDPSDASDLERDLALDIDFAEFPMSIELATRYRGEGIPVLLGAPNLVRGGSHLGNLSVREAVEADAADILCSDYHYPSLLQAPFVLAENGLAPIGRAWAMVAANAATAAGLDDRGTIAPGLLADLVVIEPPADGPPRVRAVVVGGRLVYAREACVS